LPLASLPVCRNLQWNRTEMQGRAANGVSQGDPRSAGWLYRTLYSDRLKVPPERPEWFTRLSLTIKRQRQWGCVFSAPQQADTRHLPHQLRRHRRRRQYSHEHPKSDRRSPINLSQQTRSRKNRPTNRPTLLRYRRHTAWVCNFAQTSPSRQAMRVHPPRLRNLQCAAAFNDTRLK